jgi:hypothetical protein
MGAQVWLTYQYGLAWATWQSEPLGYVNAQRSLDYIRIFAEFISQPKYKDVVTMFGIMNEPEGTVYGKENLARLLVFFFFSISFSN